MATLVNESFGFVQKEPTAVTREMSKLSEKIVNYIQARARARLEKFDKDAESQRAKVADDSAALADLNAGLAKSRTEEEAKFEPKAWLTDAASRAKQISMVTHALKFTHTDAKGTSVYVQTQASNSLPGHHYLSTAVLSEPAVDVVGNAAALDVASLLQLEDNGVSLINLIAQDDTSALAPFAESEEQLAEWMSGFKAALVDKELSSHKLAKQLYFPVAEGRYHLISPLYASSLSQALHERITASRFSEEAKAARKARREGIYCETATVDYPAVAIQSFGGTKPQNVSQLNSSRRGKSFLLNCQPPAWVTRLTPLVKHERAFWDEYDRRAWRTAKALQKFLIDNINRDSNKMIRETRADYVDSLVDLLLQFAAEVQGLTEYAGWSAESKLSMAEQLWLDPLRDDPEFRQQREAKGWQQDIANQFASWLNHKLKDDKLVMKDVEHREWSKLLERKLALLKEDLEVLAA